MSGRPTMADWIFFMRVSNRIWASSRYAFPPMVFYLQQFRNLQSFLKRFRRINNEDWTQQDITVISPHYLLFRTKLPLLKSQSSE